MNIMQIHYKDDKKNSKSTINIKENIFVNSEKQRFK